MLRPRRAAHDRGSRGDLVRLARPGRPESAAIRPCDREEVPGRPGPAGQTPVRAGPAAPQGQVTTRQRRLPGGARDDLGRGTHGVGQRRQPSERRVHRRAEDGPAEFSRHGEGLVGVANGDVDVPVWCSRVVSPCAREDDGQRRNSSVSHEGLPKFAERGGDPGRGPGRVEAAGVRQGPQPGRAEGLLLRADGRLGTPERGAVGVTPAMATNQSRRRSTSSSSRVPPVRRSSADSSAAAAREQMTYRGFLLGGNDGEFLLGEDPP